MLGGLAVDYLSGQVGTLCPNGIRVSRDRHHVVHYLGNDMFLAL
jgi:hypothetical protein